MIKWIKRSIIVLIHALCGFIFGSMCKDLGQLVIYILEPEKIDLTFLLLFLLSFLGLVIAASLVAVFIKPYWMAVVSFALCSGLILMGWGNFAVLNLALVAVHLTLGAFFVHAVSTSIKERIRFTTRVVNENKGLIIAGLLLIACGNIYVEGQKMIGAQGFRVPDMYFEMFMEPMKEKMLSQLPEEARQLEAAKMEQEFQKSIDLFQESKIEPFERYIPLAITAMLFFSLFSISTLLAFIPLMILDLIVKLLQTTNFIHTYHESQQVERLILN